MEHLKNKEIILAYLDEFAKAPITDEKYARFISDRDLDLRKHVEVFQVGCPGYVLEPHDIIAEGNKVVVRFTFHGLHLGELMGFAPTGSKLTADGIIIYELEEGKIVSHWMEFDFPTFMQQLQAASMLEKTTSV